MPSSVQASHLLLSHKFLKHKFRVLLEGHTFPVVTSSPMIEHLLMRPLLRNKRRGSRMAVLHKTKCLKKLETGVSHLKRENDLYDGYC